MLRLRGEGFARVLAGGRGGAACSPSPVRPPVSVHGSTVALVHASTRPPAYPPPVPMCLSQRSGALMALQRFARGQRTRRLFYEMLQRNRRNKEAALAGALVRLTPPSVSPIPSHPIPPT
jgi:hypothetical protein